MDYETLRFKISDGVAIITLDRKDNPANALNARMAEELFDVGLRCGAPDVRAVIVNAIGKMGAVRLMRTRIGLLAQL